MKRKATEVDVFIEDDETAIIFAQDNSILMYESEKNTKYRFDASDEKQPVHGFYNLKKEEMEEYFTTHQRLLLNCGFNDSYSGRPLNFNITRRTFTRIKDISLKTLL